jgi:hypothetical protein
MSECEALAEAVHMYSSRLSGQCCCVKGPAMLVAVPALYRQRIVAHSQLLS